MDMRSTIFVLALLTLAVPTDCFRFKVSKAGWEVASQILNNRGYMDAYNACPSPKNICLINKDAAASTHAEWSKMYGYVGGKLSTGGGAVTCNDGDQLPDGDGSVEELKEYVASVLARDQLLKDCCAACSAQGAKVVTDGIPDVSKGNPFTWSSDSNWGNYLPFENVDEAAADICIATAHNSWLATPGPFTCASGNAKYDQCVTDPEGSFLTMYQAIKDCFEAEFASQAETKLLQTSQTATTQGKAKVGCSSAGVTGTATPGCQDNDHTTDTLDPGCSDQWNCDCLFTMRVWGEDPCNGNHICAAWKAINCPGEQTKLLENNSTEPGQKADDLLSLMSDLEATKQSDGARVGWDCG